MNHKSIFQGIRALFSQHRNRWGGLAMGAGMVGALLIGAAPGIASAEEVDHCDAPYDPAAIYPALPEPSGTADLSAEAGLIIHIEEARALVELDGCLYTVDRPLLVDFDGLDFITLIVELPASTSHSEVYVHDAAGAALYTVTGSSLTYVWEPTQEVGFELAAPDQAAPTGPIVVAKPTSGNPEPD